MDNDGVCKRFILVDDEYKLFFDHHLRGDNTFLPPFDDDNGESETRNLGFEFSSGDSKLGGGGGTEKKKPPIKSRVSQKRKRETTIRESIQRDNRAAERRKMKTAELESARVSGNQVNIQGDCNKARKMSESTKVNNTSRDVPLVRAIQRDNKAKKASESTKVDTLRDVPMVRAQETIQRDKTASKVSESTKVNTLRNVPLVRAQETIQRDNNIANKMSESTKVGTLRDVPLVRAIQRDKTAKKVSESTKVDTSGDVPSVRAKEVIQRDSKARKVSESTKVNTSGDVPLVRAQDTIRRDNIAKKMSESTKVNTLRNVRAKEVIQRDNKARKVSESTTKVDTLRDVPLVRAQETTTQRDNNKAKKMSESKATGTSRVVTESKDVDETVPVTQSNKGVPVGTRKKSVADKDYMSYLTWLVDSLKDSTTVPGPTPPTPTMAPEKDIESCSDDDDMIMVSDSPFSCGGITPFVVSKSKTVIDLEKDITEEDESRNCLFTKELIDLLEKPYDKRELLRLSGDVSEKKGVSRCRELRKGRVRNYETSDLGPSYLEKVSDFEKEYRRVDGDDKARLKLLRGFFFYLKNVTRTGSFKPWLPENQKKLGGLRKQCLQP